MISFLFNSQTYDRLKGIIEVLLRNQQKQNNIVMPLQIGIYLWVLYICKAVNKYDYMFDARIDSLQSI